jgi:hypothetical protein
MLNVTFSTEFQNLGSGSRWVIVPLEGFNMTGIVWIGEARFSYGALEVQGSTVTLKDVNLSRETLAPLNITGSTVSLSASSRVNDGSLVRRKTQ